jgi:hypothetical protein
MLDKFSIKKIVLPSSGNTINYLYRRQRPEFPEIVQCIVVSGFLGFRSKVGGGGGVPWIS